MINRACFEINKNYHACESEFLSHVPVWSLESESQRDHYLVTW